MAAIGGVYIAQAGWWRRTPSVVFYDTENAWLSNLLTYPFCTAVATPHCYEGWAPKSKYHTYSGYHELAYTHPLRFSPDHAVLQEFGLDAEEPYIVLRLVSWEAAHDVRDHGFTDVPAVVRKLESYGKVVISAEGELGDLEEKRIRGPVEKIHHLLAFARLFIGESATMASESATLGTPAIFVSTSRRGYTNEQERRWSLTFNFCDRNGSQERAIAKAIELLEDPATQAEWQRRRQAMLAEMVDVTTYIADLVEAHAIPKS
jgi:predicted glycosyltransferase